MTEIDALDLGPAVVDRDRSLPLESLGGFLALSSPDAPLIADGLAERGVHVDYRGNVLRLGPAPYLTDEQLREAVGALLEVVSARLRAGEKPHPYSDLGRSSAR